MSNGRSRSHLATVLQLLGARVAYVLKSTGRRGWPFSYRSDTLTIDCGRSNPMPVTTSISARRCERKPKTMPVSLVLKGGPNMSDGSAFTLDISLRGASVRTKLPLFPGEWVGVVPQGDIPHAIPARAVWVRE